MACIDDFIDQLPLGYNTRIGQEGLTLKRGGDEQRILIATGCIQESGSFCSWMKGPAALDANNERSASWRTWNWFSRVKQC
jgi:ATP-binding cassette subfamily B protein